MPWPGYPPCPWPLSPTSALSPTTSMLTLLGPRSIPRAPKVTAATKVQPPQSLTSGLEPSSLTHGHATSQCPLGHPVTSPGCSLSTPGLLSTPEAAPCGTPSTLSHPELQLAHLPQCGAHSLPSTNSSTWGNALSLSLKAPPGVPLGVTTARPPSLPRPRPATRTRTCL